MRLYKILCILVVVTLCSFAALAAAAPSVTVKNAGSVPSSDHIILNFSERMDASTMTTGNITVNNGLTIASIISNDNGQNKEFKVTFAEKTIPAMEYRILFSNAVVSDVGRLTLTNKTAIFDISRNVFIHEQCIDFSNIFESSQGVSVGESPTPNFPNAINIPAGNSFITYKFDGEISWFYFQLLVRQTSPALTGTSHVSVEVSADNISYTALTAGASDGDEYELRQNVTPRKISEITGTGFTFTDTLANGFFGARINNNPQYIAKWKELDSNIRYVRINFTNITAANTLYLIESIARYIKPLTLETTIQQYKWDNVKIGGGGFVTGIIFHPTEPDLAYAKTDVGGLYRWDKPNRSWIPLNDMFGVDMHNCYGIDGVALDPNNPDVIYIYVGAFWYFGGGGVYKSTNRGESWTKTGLSLRASSGSSPERVDGECIMVDPNNSNVIYCGTRYDGLFVSNNGGVSWTNVSQIPVGINVNDGNKNQPYVHAGIRTIAYDTASSLAPNGRTSVLYVGVNGHGIYKTTNGGVTWSLMAGSPEKPRRMKVFESDIYVTAGYYDTVIPGTGYFRFQNGAWEDITPEIARDYPICGHEIVRDSEGNLNLFLSVAKATSAGPLYKKTENNDWETVWDLGEAFDHADLSEFMGWSDMRSTFAAALEANPFPEEEGKIELWITDGRGVYRNKDMENPQVKFTAEVQGIEECCLNVITAPHSGEAELFSGIWDFGGYRHTNVSEYSATSLGQVKRGPGVPRSFWHIQTLAFDYCEENPDFVASYTQAANFIADGCVVLSEDNGVNWHDNGWSRTESNKGDVAVSSRLNENGYPTIVAIAYGAVTPAKYSEDFGKTWYNITGLEAYTAYDNSTISKTKFLLASDRVNPDYFYFYDDRSGCLYVSSDGGKSFIKSDTTARPQTNKNPFFQTNVKTKPNSEGEVWVSAYDSGLYKSSDYGQSLDRICGIENVEGFGFGAEAPSTGEVTVFVLGVINNIRGLYRSDDNAKSWILVNDERQQMGVLPTYVEGDRRVFGRVYVGTTGRGILMGEIQENESGITILSKQHNKEMLTASAFLKNNDNIEANGYIVLALYDDDRNLLAVNIDKYKIQSGGQDSVTAAVSINGNHPNTHTKAFLWRDDLTPICDSW